MTITNIIAIDGPAASGKGTIAKRLAAHLDYAHMDTGALYRLVGHEVLQEGGDPSDEEQAVAAALFLKDNFDPSMCNNPLIRTAEAGQAASKVGIFPKVRAALYELQVNFAKYPPNGKAGAVLDGRDIGSVICPHADVKLFITANVEVRAKRRYEELMAKNGEVTYEEILADMIARDDRDENRKNAPSKAAEDALIIDTSDMNVEEAFTYIWDIINHKIQKNNA